MRTMCELHASYCSVMREQEQDICNHHSVELDGMSGGNTGWPTWGVRTAALSAAELNLNRVLPCPLAVPWVGCSRDSLSFLCCALGLASCPSSSTVSSMHLRMLAREACMCWLKLIQKLWWQNDTTTEACSQGCGHESYAVAHVGAPLVRMNASRVKWKLVKACLFACLANR